MAGLSYAALSSSSNKFVRPRWPYVMRPSVCHCNSLGGAKWRSRTGRTGRTDGQTDRQTDGQTDRVRRNMRPPPREEGRIIRLQWNHEETFLIPRTHHDQLSRRCHSKLLSLFRKRTLFTECNSRNMVCMCRLLRGIMQTNNEEMEIYSLFLLTDESYCAHKLGSELNAQRFPRFYSEAEWHAHCPIVSTY